MIDPQKRIVQLDRILLLTAVELEGLVEAIRRGWPYYDDAYPLPCSNSERHTHYTSCSRRCREELDAYTRPRRRKQ